MKLHSNLIFSTPNDNIKEVLRIESDGRIFWNQREVETDDEFRAAMLDLRDLLLGVKGANPMIQAALDAGEDATGLCTLREFAEQMLKHPLPEGCNHWIGFKLGEKHYTMFCLLKENPCSQEP